MHRARAILATCATLCLVGIQPAMARQTGAASATASYAVVALSDYVGTYASAKGVIEIVAGQRLLAVINEAGYPLTRVEGDMFANSLGQRIPFRRGADGQIDGFQEQGVFYARRSSRVAPRSAALLTPRPRGAVSAYHYRPPRDRGDGIAVGDISATPLGREAAEHIVAGILDQTWPDVHSVLIFQGGRLVLEEYFYGYDADRTHQLRSATKSIVSAVVGAAVDAKALNGVSQLVVNTLPYGDYANADPRKARITLGDLLTMRPGLACDDHDENSPGRETAIYPQADWVKAVLDLPMINDPGTTGFYCSGGVAVAGRMVERATGQALPDYAQAHLFGPLGVPRSAWTWNYTLTSANLEYAQIHLRPRDMLKVGILYNQEGRWHGRQVLSADWIKASLAAQSKVEGTDYGYFWWRPTRRITTAQGQERVMFEAAQGNGGQKIYVVPQYDLVAVFTAGSYNSSAAANKIMDQEILPKLVAAAKAAR